MNSNNNNSNNNVYNAIDLYLRTGDESLIIIHLNEIEEQLHESKRIGDISMIVSGDSDVIFRRGNKRLHMVYEQYSYFLTLNDSKVSNYYTRDTLGQFILRGRTTISKDKITYESKEIGDITIQVVDSTFILTGRGQDIVTRDPEEILNLSLSISNSSYIQDSSLLMIEEEMEQMKMRLVNCLKKTRSNNSRATIRDCKREATQEEDEFKGDPIHENTPILDVMKSLIKDNPALKFRFGSKM